MNGTHQRGSQQHAGDHSANDGWLIVPVAPFARTVGSGKSRIPTIRHGDVVVLVHSLLVIEARKTLVEFCGPVFRAKVALAAVAAEETHADSVFAVAEIALPGGPGLGHPSP